MTERFCIGCHIWYDAKLNSCPDCGRPKSRFNAGLYNARWNSNLLAQAARAEQTKRQFGA